MSARTRAYRKHRRLINAAVAAECLIDRGYAMNRAIAIVLKNNPLSFASPIWADAAILGNYMLLRKARRMRGAR